VNFATAQYASRYDSASGLASPNRYEQPAVNTIAHTVFADRSTCFERCELPCELANVFLNTTHTTTMYNCLRLRPPKPSLLKLTSSGTSIIMIIIGCIAIIMITSVVCCCIVNCCRSSASSRQGATYLTKEQNNEQFIEVKPGTMLINNGINGKSGNGLLLHNGHTKGGKMDRISEASEV